MRISVIYTANGPFKIYRNQIKAIREYERLRDLDDFVDYSLIELPVEDSPPMELTANGGEIEVVLRTSDLKRWHGITKIGRSST